MSECLYNYSLKDNLDASKFLFKTKNKRKTNIVTILLFCLTFVGIMVSIGAIIMHNKSWYVGILGVLLLACYFLIDKIALNSFLKNQQDYFYNSDLKKVTKVKVCVDENIMTETFLIKENVLGTNTYQKADLTAIKINNETIIFVFKDQSVVMVKRACLNQKAEINFLNFANNILGKKNKQNSTQTKKK